MKTFCLSEDIVDLLMKRAQTIPAYNLTVDLETEKITDDHGFEESFVVDPFRRHCLLNGLDDIGMTLQHEPDITSYESKRPSWKRGVAA